MTITYTWSVMELNTVNTAEDQNVVIKTKWKKIGTDKNGHSGFFMGCTSFDAASVAPNTFVPFDQLTEEIVIGWIQAVVVGNYEIHVNEQIDVAIAASIVQEPPLPWLPPEPTPVPTPTLTTS